MPALEEILRVAVSDETRAACADAITSIKEKMTSKPEILTTVPEKESA